MRLTRAIAVLTVALLLLALQALPALAAPPSNDTIGGATVASLGFSQELDTTEATTDTDDFELNLGCGAPATDASVWYSYTAAADGSVVVDARGSDYSVSVLVAAGTPGNFVTCSAGKVAFTAVAGTTYYILAVDDQGDGNYANGGTLRISFFTPPPPPTMGITVDPFGRVDLQTGVASLSGTYTCSNADLVDVSGQARQVLPRSVIVGSGFFRAFGTCDGTAHPWSATVVPDSGKFVGGKAMTLTFAFSCGEFDCVPDSVERTVILRGGKP
jgi:Family of unknown function (DUF6299)